MGDFERHYQSKDVARNYDELRFSSRGGHYIDRREQDVILRGLPPPSSGRILEIGCGTGRLTETLLRIGYRVLSIDPSEAMLNKARARIDALHDQIKSRSELQVGSGFDLSSLQNGFSAAISLRVFIHLTLDEAAILLKQVNSHLVPGGVFCFDTLNPWSPNVMIWPLNLTKGGYAKNTFIDRSRLKQTISETGFEVRGVESLFVVPIFMIRVAGPFSGPLIGINRLLEMICKPLGGHVFWKVKK